MVKMGIIGTEACKSCGQEGGEALVEGRSTRGLKVNDKVTGVGHCGVRVGVRSIKGGVLMNYDDSSVCVTRI